MRRAASRFDLIQRSGIAVTIPPLGQCRLTCDWQTKHAARNAGVAPHRLARGKKLASGHRFKPLAQGTELTATRAKVSRRAGASCCDWPGPRMSEGAERWAATACDVHQSKARIACLDCWGASQRRQLCGKPTVMVMGSIDDLLCLATPIWAAAMQRNKPVAGSRFPAAQFHESWSRSAVIRVGRRQWTQSGPAESRKRSSQARCC